MRIDVPRRRPAGIRLTPLIDVVFILLVFFMLASSFLDWRAFELGLPPAEATPDPDSNPIVIDVTAAGAIELAGEPVPAGELARRIAAMLRERSDRPVLVRPDDQAPVQATVGVLDRLQSGGIEAASLAGKGP